MKVEERPVTLFISFLDHKDDALKKTLWMLRMCKLLCIVTWPHEYNKTVLGKFKWTVSLSAFYNVRSIFIHNIKRLFRRKPQEARVFLHQNISISSMHTDKEK